MKTYQDYEYAMRQNRIELDKMNFVNSVITDYRSSDDYKEALAGREYYNQQNTTIVNFVKYLNRVYGDKIKDIWSPNYKIQSGFYYRFTTQEIAFLLGNGVNWSDEKTADRLGNKKFPFDNQLKKLTEKARWGKVAHAYWNLDHIEVFSALEYAPLLDEETGLERCGVRFWQVAPDKPTRATFYEADGLTEYMWYDKDEVLTDGWTILDTGYAYKPKRSYKQIVTRSEFDGEEITDGGNYNGFPVVPMWGDSRKISSLTGLRPGIDAYDLLKSGLANDVDEANTIYWLFKGAGGMDDADLQKAISQLKLLHAVNLPDEVDVDAHSTETPYNSTDSILDRLEKDLYMDAMALDYEKIASGSAVTAQIEAAYEPLNQKCDSIEYCVSDFLQRLMELVGIDDEYSFTRSKLVNTTELIQAVLSSAPYLGEDYVTKKILTLLGDGDQAVNVIAERTANDVPQLTTDEEVTAGEIDKAITEAEQAIGGGKTLNGAQTQSLISIMQQYATGALSEGQAINLIATAIGLSKDEARDILLGN